MAAGQRLIGCANPSTGRTGEPDERATALPLRRTFTAPLYGAPFMATALDNEGPGYPGPAGPATNGLATETGAGEQCAEADEAGLRTGPRSLAQCSADVAYEPGETECWPDRDTSTAPTLRRGGAANGARATALPLRRTLHGERGGPMNDLGIPDRSDRQPTDLQRKRALPNKALKRTKRGILLVGALRAPSSLNRASPLSAVLGRP